MLCNSQRKLFGAGAMALALGLCAAPALAKDDGDHRRSQRRQRDHRGHDDHNSKVRVQIGFGDHGRHPRHGSLSRHRGHGDWHGGHIEYEKRWVPPIYETRYDDCGYAFKVLVRDGYYTRVPVNHRSRHRGYHRSRYHGRRHYSGGQRHHSQGSGFRVSGTFHF